MESGSPIILMLQSSAKQTALVVFSIPILVKRRITSFVPTMNRLPAVRSRIIFLDKACNLAAIDLPP